jgi:hypothetical protein
MSARPRGLLFLMRSPVYVRNFEPVLEQLGSRGVRTTVLFEERKDAGDATGLGLMRRLCAEHESLGFELLPPLSLGVRGRLRKALRAGQDYLRYFDEPYTDAAKLRSRAAGRVPNRLERALAALLGRWTGPRRMLVAGARLLDVRLGEEREIRRELEARGPAVLAVTPLVQLRSRQSDWVRAAQGMGIRTILCVHSWDNLTNKGVMHAQPDLVAVWNEAQRREAIELHGVAAGATVVAGAWPYDHWFGWEARRSRAELCRELGLSGDAALLLYVCSSEFIAQDERAAVLRWIRALRSSGDPRLEGAGVIVRPHPLNAEEWGEGALAGEPSATVFPPRGADPVDDASRSDYFDSMAHADAVVGINTSALLEATVVGRPALALPDPEFLPSQHGLPHFRLLAGEGGAVEVARSTAEHLSQLVHAVSTPDTGAGSRRRFVHELIRPHGDAPTPSERVVAAIEELLAGVSAAPDEPSLAAVP